jgi:hypothetical protein
MTYGQIWLSHFFGWLLIHLPQKIENKTLIKGKFYTTNQWFLKQFCDGANLVIIHQNWL